MDREGRSLSVFLLTALFRAAGVAVVALAALALLDRIAPDPVLLAVLAGFGGASLFGRSLVRHRRITISGAGMAAILLALATLLVVCVQRTGGLHSPLVILLGVLVATGALTLTPLANFFSISGVCLLVTVMVIATAEGLLPRTGLGASLGATPPPFTLLLIELGLIVVVGFAVNGLAGRLRGLREELACRELRDPETGTLRSTFFHARLVALLGARRGGREGVAVILIDVGELDERLMADAGALLQESVRGDDLAGRIARRHFAAAIVTASDETGPRVARRLAEDLRRLGQVEIRAGVAHLEAAAIGDDTVESARELMAAAEAKLAAEAVGFAA